MAASAARSSRARQVRSASTRSPVARAALREGLERAAGRRSLDGRRARHPAARRSPRTTRPRSASRSTTTLHWHLHDLWPELQLPGSSLLYEQLGPAHRAAARASRADDARPDRPRRAAPHPRALPDDQRTRAPRSLDLVAQIAPQLLAEPGFGPLTGGQARSARSPAPSASPATPSSPAPAASPRSRSAPARPTATASTAAATARSTPPSTASPSPALRCHPETQRLHRPQTRRRQDHQRSHPLPQTPPRPPHLAPTHRRRPTRSRTPPPINFLT